MRLSEIPINSYTVSEMVRLSLRKRDAETESNAGSEDSDDSLAEHDDDVVSTMFLTGSGSSCFLLKYIWNDFKVVLIKR